MMGCHDGLFYSQYKSPNEKGWNKKNSLVYDLPKVEEESAFDVNVGIRIWENFEYKSIILISRLYEDKKMVSVDTLYYNFYDSSDKSTGKGVGIVEHTKTLDHKYVLKPKHKYKVKINHHMLHNPITRVDNVGVSLNYDL